MTPADATAELHTPALTEAARRWLSVDPDPETRAELEALLAAGDWQEIGARFSGRLQFGTAGLRAPMGAGPMRMNRVVVRQATAGLVDYVGPGATIVIGYDARHRSDVFAHDAAGVVTAAGGHAVLLDRAVPTPVLAFAVRMLDADAGVMVTASHNPPADNGYKVYLGDGAQIVPPVDAAIALAIDEAARLAIAVASDGWEVEGHVVIDGYLTAAQAALLEDGFPDGARSRDLNWVYTAMHGVGRRVLMSAFERAGFPPPHVVAAQGEPDPDFPTVAFPNPEEPGALDLALAEAVWVGADLVIANDPDADRLGVAVPDPERGGPGVEGWRVLTGNEVGWLLADHVLGRTRGDDRLVATTIVSSRLLAKLAAAAGVGFVQTLTGFKWLMRAALDRPREMLVFSYEEALGYAIGEIVRDKDGITAALAIASLAAEVKAAGSSITERLDSLARRFGLHTTGQVSIKAFGVGDQLRATLADRTHLAGLPIRSVRDLLDKEAAAAGLGPGDGRVASDEAGSMAQSELPLADVLVFELAGDVQVIVRPSGTEPKTKVYLELVREVTEADDLAVMRAEASAELDRLAAALRQELTPTLESSPAPRRRP